MKLDICPSSQECQRHTPPTTPGRTLRPSGWSLHDAGRRTPPSTSWNDTGTTSISATSPCLSAKHMICTDFLWQSDWCSNQSRQCRGSGVVGRKFHKVASGHPSTRNSNPKCRPLPPRVLAKRSTPGRPKEGHQPRSRAQKCLESLFSCQA